MAPKLEGEMMVEGQREEDAENLRLVGVYIGWGRFKKF